MKIFAIVGNSGSGKTRLISLLIPELKRRGNSVAVIKRCSHGFSLSPEGKDSWKFEEAGSDSVMMTAPGQMALVRKEDANPPPSAIAAKYFFGMDIVLVEGGRKDRSLGKICMLRKGVSEQMDCSSEELLAVVSDFEPPVDKPVFRPDQVKEIADFIDSHHEDQESTVSLDIDGVSVPIKSFVQNVFERTVMGIISTLRGIKDNPERVTLSISRQEKTDGKK